jgi:uracil-DNA glycosylase family 4
MKKEKAHKVTRDELRYQFDAHCADLQLVNEVFSDGPVNADVAFVGEGPGETELRRGLPFVGGTGKLLWECVSKYDLDRGNVYTTNVVKRQISLSRKGSERHQVYRDELDKWIGLLQWELSQLPNVHTVFVLGNYALEAIVGLESITKWRGSVLDAELPNGKVGKVVCSFNPAYVTEQREPKFEPFFRMDCAKLRQVLDGKFKKYEIDAIINPTYRETLALIKDLRRANKPVALDVEAINRELACIGLSNDPHRATCIAFRDLYKNRFTLSEECDILCAIQDLCDSHKMVAQNAQFDAYFSRLHVWLDIKFWYDTLLAHHTLFPQLPHNLAFMVAQYTNHPFYKDEGKQWQEGGDLDSYWEYNCKDTALTFRIMERTLEELKRERMDEFFFNHVMRAQPHLVEATVHGVAVDLPVKDRILELVREDVAQAKAKFHDYVHQLTGEKNYNPNPNSPPQMQELLFDKLKLVGRGRSTDEANRNEITKNPKTPALAKEMLTALDKFKEEDKFRGTYAEARVSEDGRFRCEYKQFGVSKAPGRLSSSQLLVEKDGANMQNQPMRARGMFVADPGCVLLYFDLAQAEAQVVGYRADIPIWQEQFAKAKKDIDAGRSDVYDCHRALASQMFNMPYDQVPKKDWDANLKPTKRYIAKRCRHGLNYRMQQFRLSQVTQLPYHEATYAFVLYHRITPQLRKWWAEEERLFKRDKCIFNAFGRRLKVIQKIDDDVLESIIAYYPQSTIGDKIVRVWYQCEEDDDWPDQMYARVGIDVHDNLVAITTPQKAKTCLRILKKYAEEPIMVQDVYKKHKHQPLSISAELKMSYPSSWDDKTKKFVKDVKGLHRWSEMEVVKL